MSNTKELWMEDVTHICAQACDYIQDKLYAFDIKLTDEKEDELFDAIQAILELEGTGDYKNHM